jgi:hypothetical protein
MLALKQFIFFHRSCRLMLCSAHSFFISTFLVGQKNSTLRLLPHRLVRIDQSYWPCDYDYAVILRNEVECSTLRFLSRFNTGSEFQTTECSSLGTWGKPMDQILRFHQTLMTSLHLVPSNSKLRQEKSHVFYPTSLPNQLA